MKESFWRTMAVVGGAGDKGRTVYDIARLEVSPVTSVWYRLKALCRDGYVDRIDSGKRGNVEAVFRYCLTPEGRQELYLKQLHCGDAGHAWRLTERFWEDGTIMEKHHCQKCWARRTKLHRHTWTTDSFSGITMPQYCSVCGVKKK